MAHAASAAPAGPSVARAASDATREDAAIFAGERTYANDAVTRQYSAMVRYAETSEADKFLVVTECGLSDRLLMEIPNKHFYKACKLCRYMKTVSYTHLTLPTICSV